MSKKYELLFFFEDQDEEDPTITEIWNHVPQINSIITFDYPNKYKGYYLIKQVEYRKERNKLFITLLYHDCL